MECVCKHKMTRHDWKNQWVCHRCGRTKSITQTQTNADRIRAMSDEQLADVLREFATKPMQGSFLKWLKQPTEV